MEAELRYEIHIYWSHEDGAFLAEVPELPGCMADGPTYAIALNQAIAAIRAWIATARELGREVPDPRPRPHAI
jgi:predicted RNase H-like HicB family nuclease